MGVYCILYRGMYAKVVFDKHIQQKFWIDSASFIKFVWLWLWAWLNYLSYHLERAKKNFHSMKHSNHWKQIVVSGKRFYKNSLLYKRGLIITPTKTFVPSKTLLCSLKSWVHDRWNQYYIILMTIWDPFTLYAFLAQQNTILPPF